MKTNFDFLLKEPKFKLFARAAVNAERAFRLDFALCATSCRMALEFAVKWLYTADSALVMPHDTKLITLIAAEEFQDIMDPSLLTKIHYIRKLGNSTTHGTGSISRDQVVLALRNLHCFLDFIAYCYGEQYEETAFDEALLEAEPEPSIQPQVQLDFERLRKENESLRAELTKRRQERGKSYTAEPYDPTEAQTRKAYIDVMLMDAGWERGKNWQDEYPIGEMPNKSGSGAADYVLFGNDGKPLAVIEAKRTSVSVEKGRQQAVLYADSLEKKFGRRPVIFLTNGYETRIWNDRYYPERAVSGIYSPRDLLQEFHIMQNRAHLHNARVNDSIAGRYYQKEAAKAVCDTFDKRNRRKALLVMATGSGKTRTVISIADVLMQSGWVKNILFLADRSSLVTQAKRSFHSLMPNLSLCNLTEGKEDASARAVFSTYQTMMNCIDETKDDDGKKLFTCGHFDLIIVDEAHRSIYNKYKDIFTYFDALLIGLTATPKDEIDKNTYEIFQLESGVPTYGYELAQAVEDGYLVDFVSIETKLKFIFDGITYADLSPDEQAEYETTFSGEDGAVPERIESGALNDWIFNKDTIRRVLSILMTNGLKVDYGSKIGKTVIFAKSHKHAEKILQVWNEEYPHYPQHFCRVIDNYTKYAQSLIDCFSDAEKLPQIAISVDMLDTGIDVPEILNLVFFKKVMSKSKFWQMIGRGTRPCPGLIDGADKKMFYIFDFCNNFAFFRVGGTHREAGVAGSIQERIFNLKTEIVYKLQDLAYQTAELQAFRRELTEELLEKIAQLPRDNFAVHQHLRMIDTFGTKKAFEALTYENTLQVAQHLAPLLPPDADEISAVRFDALIYQIELCCLMGKPYKKARRDLAAKVTALAGYATIPAVGDKQELIHRVLHTDCLDTAGIGEFENIRTQLRGLIRFIERKERETYDTDFTDNILSTEWNQSKLENDDLLNYKHKVNYYISQNQDKPAIAKLKGNIPLLPEDVRELEQILWSEVGTKEEYRKEYGDTPLGELVRSIVGLSMQAANQAFSQFLDQHELNPQQMYFVKQIINYIVKNGTMRDYRVLGESPFTDMGSVSELFENTVVFLDLRRIIEQINRNALGKQER